MGKNRDKKQTEKNWKQKNKMANLLILNINSLNTPIKRGKNYYG